MAKSQSWIEFQAKLKANTHAMKAAEQKAGVVKHFPPQHNKIPISPYYLTVKQTAEMRMDLFDKIMADNADTTPLPDENMEKRPNPTPQEIARDVEELVAATRVVSKRDPAIFQMAKKRQYNYGTTQMKILSGQLKPTTLDRRSQEILNMRLPRPKAETETDDEIGI